MSIPMGSTYEKPVMITFELSCNSRLEAEQEIHHANHRGFVAPSIEVRIAEELGMVAVRHFEESGERIYVAGTVVVSFLCSRQALCNVFSNGIRSDRVSPLERVSMG